MGTTGKGCHRAMSTPSCETPTPGAVPLLTKAAEHRVHDKYGDTDGEGARAGAFADVYSHKDLAMKGSSTRPPPLSYEERNRADQEEIRRAKEAQSKLDREREWQLKRG